MAETRKPIRQTFEAKPSGKRSRDYEAAQRGSARSVISVRPSDFNRGPTPNQSPASSPSEQKRGNDE